MIQNVSKYIIICSYSVFASPLRGTGASRHRHRSWLRLLPSRLGKAQVSLALRSLLRQLSYPAGVQSAVSGSEAKMLHGNAEVDVTMRFAVFGTHPAAAHILETKYIQRHRLEPVAVVALPDLLFRIVGGEKKKLPWLAVAGRRSQPHAVHDILNILLADRLFRVLTHGEALRC